MKDKFTHDVMVKIADNEARRLKIDVETFLPIIFILLVLFSILINRSFTILIAREADHLVLGIKRSELRIDQYLFKAAQIIWEKLEIQLFIAGVLSLAALVAVMAKSQIFSLPRRFREISRYREV